ncbi:hypothetical protein B7939_03790 [Eggerthia catenaformis]|nr:hypothetical protein B7939_03790 [Eggerthia catenaformis]
MRIVIAKSDKGNVLQITLIIYCILLSFVVIYSSFIIQKNILYKYEDKLNQQRQIEVYMKRYFIKKIANYDYSSGQVADISYRIKGFENNKEIECIFPKISKHLIITIDQTNLSVLNWQWC